MGQGTLLIDLHASSFVILQPSCKLQEFFCPFYRCKNRDTKRLKCSSPAHKAGIQWSQDFNTFCLTQSLCSCLVTLDASSPTASTSWEPHGFQARSLTVCILLETWVSLHTRNSFLSYKCISYGFLAIWLRPSVKVCFLCVPFIVNNWYFQPRLKLKFMLRCNGFFSSSPRQIAIRFNIFNRLNYLICIKQSFNINF